ncbi:MAG: rhodanese-like domain-containing protein [Tissierellia bacterium]|nr:rhodanese-like domain-containing protein [Tissierellia bacterium]
MNFFHRYKWAIVFFGLGIIFTLARFIVGPSIPEGYTKLEKSEVESVLNAEGDKILIDLRDKQSYTQGHLPNSISIAPRELTAARMEELSGNKTKPIIVMSDTDKSSSKIALKIGHTGYTKVYDLGGFENWKHMIP